MIGITFALPTESSDLISRLKPSQRQDELLIGKIDNRDVAIVHTGVGAKTCDERLELLIHKTRPRFVISAGFAGAVTNESQPGDLILSENFSDPQLLAQANKILHHPKPRTVKLFTVTSIIDSVEQRREVARKCGAAAVDMETGAIANLCRAHAIRLLSLRAISDSPAEPFPAPPHVLFDVERQQTNLFGLLTYLFRHPSVAPKLVRFSKRIAHARGKMTDAIIALVREL